MHRCLALLVLFGCDEPSGSGTVDAARLDRGRVEAGLDRGPLDRGPLDAGRDADLDGRVVDARPLDARPVDAQSVDAGPPDVRPMDARAPDRGPPDAAQPDMPVLDAFPPDAAPPPPCVGIVLPPPPDSPDGSEVCNYRDDDGDGLVDEGFPYDFIGEPVRITLAPENHPQEVKIAWSGDGYGVAWYSAPGFRFAKLDTWGCPTRALQSVDQNPARPFLPDSLELAFAGDRFAVAFTQERRQIEGSPGGFGTFVQLFDREGQRVGELIDVDPTISHLRFNSIVPFGDQFAIFSSAYHPQRGGLSYSAFIMLDRDGHIVLGPSHPYDVQPGLGQGMSNLIGMAFDGEGFGMAWHGVDNWFMRWSPEGVVLTQPTRVDTRLSRFSGIAWNGSHYVVPSDGAGFRGEGVFLSFLRPDGGAADWSPVQLGTSRLGGFSYKVAPFGQGFLHYGATDNVMPLERLGPQGQRMPGPLPIPRERGFLDFVSTEEGIGAVFTGGLAENGSHVSYVPIGCPR